MLIRQSSIRKWPTKVDWSPSAATWNAAGCCTPIDPAFFPWYDDSVLSCWWSPDPRAIFELDAFHCSRRLERTIAPGNIRPHRPAFVKVMMAAPPRGRKLDHGRICWRL